MGSALGCVPSSNQTHDADASEPSPEAKKPVVLPWDGKATFDQWCAWTLERTDKGRVDKFEGWERDETEVIDEEELLREAPVAWSPNEFETLPETPYKQPAALVSDILPGTPFTFSDTDDSAVIGPHPDALGDTDAGPGPGMAIFGVGMDEESLPLERRRRLPSPRAGTPHWPSRSQREAWLWKERTFWEQVEQGSGTRAGATLIHLPQGVATYACCRTDT